MRVEFQRQLGVTRNIGGYFSIAVENVEKKVVQLYTAYRPANVHAKFNTFP